MEDNVRATYICYKCDNEYVQFNMKEGEPAKCPQCKTTNYPGYEVIPIRLFHKIFEEKFIENRYKSKVFDTERHQCVCDKIF